MFVQSVAEVAVLIVSFCNPTDVVNCVTSLSDAAAEPEFDVFICENGGQRWFQALLEELTTEQGPCLGTDQIPISKQMESHRFTDIRSLCFRARPSRVWVGCARANLGYGGGINAWLEQLKFVTGWKGAWILNPDTAPEANALSALVARAAAGQREMVGSTIMDPQMRNQIACRGGLHWQRFAARTMVIGLGDSLTAPFDLSKIEAAMDCPSGASMYVTRRCFDKIGLMDERYFLYFEDLDWGQRAKACGLGYASESLVWHKRGTTTGSGAQHLARIPQFVVYLWHRNGIHFVLKFFPWAFPIQLIFSFLHAINFLIHRAPLNCAATLKGVFAGLRGEIGLPAIYSDSINSTALRNDKN